MQRLPSRGKPSKPPPKPPPALETVRNFRKSSSAATAPHTEESIKDLFEGDDDSVAREYDSPPTAPVPATASKDNDVFETPQEVETADQLDLDPSGIFGSGYDELPVEIQSLMERFLESLVSRAQPAPLSIDRLSELYQDFYEHAHTQIGTHIAALCTKISREASPSPSISSGRSSISRGGRRKPPDRKTTLDGQSNDQQLLTALEVTDRRKARRQLEVKRAAMEEAVERGVCEKVYPRIWRHGSTDDEARDEKLRSKAAALSVVGVNLKELLSTAFSEDVTLSQELQKSSAADDALAQDQLSQARISLRRMNEERFPMGKLMHLTAVHRAIVAGLQQMFPSASSADEVLPTLIYTIITSPPESNSVISNLNFIQRFRAASKIDGEAAYCLTNIEAAISFLENVDLSSIRSGEAPQGPQRPISQTSTPRSENADPMYRALPSSPLEKSIPLVPSPPTSGTRPRASSGLRPFEAASNAVRSSANDIQTALDGGFKFLFGRLNEQRAASSPVGSLTPATPRTLEDARKLVSEQTDTDDTDSIAESRRESKADDEPDADTLRGMALAEEALRLVNGPPRDRSVDSSKSGASIGSRGDQQRKASLAQTSSQAAAQGYNPIDSVRNLGNVINPFRGFSGMAMSRGFGRTTSADHQGSSSPLAAARSNTTVTPEKMAVPSGSDIDWSSIAPPIPRFVQCKDARTLNFFEVELLLRDYQRLAGAASAASSSARPTS